ncbi:MAG: autotransporter-associated beta strand repeat-containing protein [Verrucomicrobiota bacterium]
MNAYQYNDSLVFKFIMPVYAALALAHPASLGAATKTWTGGTDGNWNTAANWSASGVPANNDYLVFGTQTRKITTNNVASLAISGLVFTNGGFAFYGNSLTVKAGITNQVGTNSISIPLTLLSNPKLWDVAAGAELVVAGDTVTGTATGNPPYRKYNPGNVRFKGSNYWAKGADLYNGNTILDGGSITITNDGFRLTADNGGVARLVITNNGWLSLGTFGASPNLKLGGTANLTGTNELHLSSGQVILDQTLQQVIVGDTAGTIGVVYQSGGIVRYTNNYQVTGGLLLGNSANSSGTYNFNGGTLLIPRILQNLGQGFFYFNGGTLKPSSSQFAATFLEGLTEARIRDGGAQIDTDGLDIVIRQALLAGGTGGLTKNGLGSLTLGGANTYTGPTTLTAGKLVLSTLQSGGGAISVADNTELSISVAAAGSSLNTSALTLGGGIGGTNDFALGASGNPASPVIHATNLTVNGTFYVNITGAGFSVGQFPLIKYGAASGLSDATFLSNSLPIGVEGFLSNNLANSSVDLVITLAPNIYWQGQTNGVVAGDWDVATTANWYDLLSAQATIFTHGASVRFEDSATGTNTANIVAEVYPGGVVVSNNVKNFTFVGGSGIGGSGRVIKDGTGLLNVGVPNSYSADTLILGGTFQLGANEVIPDGSGKGNVVLNGKLDLAGFNETVNGLSGSGVIDNSAGTGTNVLTVGNANSSGAFAGAISNSFGALAVKKTGSGTLALNGNNSHIGGTTLVGGTLQLGNDGAAGFGPLTVTVPAAGATLGTFGGARVITNEVNLIGGNGYVLNVDTTAGDLILDGPFFNAGTEVDKRGSNDLHIKSSVPARQSGLLGLYKGAFILDGVSWTNEDGAVRFYADAGETVRLVITNGATLQIGTLGGNMNLRLGYTANLVGTNQIDISSGQLLLDQYFNQIYLGDAANTISVFNQSGGAVKYQNTVNTAAGIVFGTTAGSVGTYNFNGGTLEVPRIRQALNTASGYFNWNGGTLRPSSGLNATTFFTGVTATTIQNGGAIIDTAGYDITIGQSLTAGGSGGLTKFGVGTLTLTGTNTYTGATLVTTGGLIVSTFNIGGGSYASADGTTLGVTVTSPGTSLNAAAITLGNGGNSTLKFDFGYLGNTGIPAAYVTNLIANGTVTVSLTGLNTVVGQFPLIKYEGSIGGNGYAAFVLDVLPPEIGATLVNNAANSTIDLLITNATPAIWTGATSTNWDINASANWSNNSLPVNYFNGNAVIFDDSATLNTNINLTGSLLPGSIQISNQNNAYSFVGPGKISGITGLLKQGGGSLTINTTNDFTGPVVIQGGTVIAANSNALGSAAGGTVITNGGTLDVFGVLLSAYP